MKFNILNKQKENITNLMRKIGYFNIGSSFIRPMNRGGYPRFHLYVEQAQDENEIILNLHLDQKRPVYKNTTAHSGEYEGAGVEQETARIKQILG
ncbi:hypothetical protein CL633_02775 [bacterium]|nr:hypothetical protein [bacterium]|tara:strand:+ start:4296 stop:4580 length:285 start_codon:yes stop_codon:yes gene_type:complete